MSRPFFALLLGLLTSASAPAAQEPTPPNPAVEDLPAFAASPAQLLAAPGTVDVTGHDGEVLLEEGVFQFDEAGRRTFSYRLIYRILTESGVDGWDTTSAWWSPWRQSRPEIKARVVSPDGREHWLDPATIVEQKAATGDGDVFSNQLVLEAPLPALGVGAVVETQRILRDTDSPFNQGDAHSFAWGWWVPARVTRVVVDAPDGLPLRWRTRLMDDLQPVETRNEGRLRLVFETESSPPLEDLEGYLPPDTAARPFLELSTGESWGAIARLYAGIVDDQIRDQPLPRSVTKALRGARNRREKIDRLLAWLQEEVRYTGLELDEAAIVPRTPPETLKRGYGDCKDQAALLVALLRSAEIPAHVALLRVGRSLDLHPELPALGAFDHAIVYVPEGPGEEPAIWIDPTSRFSRAGELPAGDTGRWALVAAPGTTDLLRTPEGSAEENFLRKELEVFLADLGRGRVEERLLPRGVHELEYRNGVGRFDQGELDEFFEEFIKDSEAEAVFELASVTDAKDLERPFQLRVVSSNRGYAITELANAAVAVDLADSFYALPEHLKAEPAEGEEPRVNDFLVPQAMTLETEVLVHPPAGFVVADLPETEQRQLGPASYRQEAQLEDDGSVRLLLRLEVPQRRLSPEQMAELRDGMVEILEDGPLLLEFDNVGELHLATGEIRKALDEFRAAAEAQPEKSLPRTRISRALLAAGVGQAARQEARKAVELEPELALSHRNLGWVRIHDQLGREFRAGSDYAGAEAAFRKALELDPEDTVARAQLAILLEHDEEGWRYRSENRMEKAITEYRALREADHHSMDDNLLIALVRSGRFEEAGALAEEMPQTTTVKVLRVVTTSALEGSGKGVREASRLSSDGELGGLLSNAANILLLVRRYPEAADLLAAAARHQANPVPVLAQAARVRKMKRRDEILLPPDDPKAAVIRAAIAQVTGDGFRDSLSHRVVPGERFDSEVEDVRRTLAPLLRSARESGGSLETILDAMANNLEITLEGRDELGFRARVAGFSTQQVSEETFYLIPEDGTYRLLSLSSDILSLLGVMALEHLDRGDPKGARQWLDWAAEGMAAQDTADPMSGHPLAPFWKRGREGTEDEIRVAAAALIAWGPHPEKAVAILTAARNAAPEDRRLDLEVALIRAHFSLGQPEEGLALVRPLHERFPDAEVTAARTMSGLLEAGQYQELETVIERILQRDPDDQTALLLRADLRAFQGDLEQAIATYRQVIGRGQAPSVAYNNLAWYSLILGDPEGEALEMALRASEKSEDPSNLHTLAVAYAEADQADQARQVILRSMAVAGDEEPQPHDWYVLGRIAESYGVADAAAEAYAKVEAPEASDRMGHTSTFVLARRRLEKLATAEVREARASREPREQAGPSGP